VPELVGEEQVDVAEATAFFQAANRLTIFLGPPLAGVLIGVIGTANVLYLDAASYVASFALVATFVHPPAVEAPEDTRGIFAGARFLFSDRLLRVWTPALTVLDVAWMVVFASLPVLVVSEYDANPRILGWLFGALGGGAVVGAIVALRAVRRIEALTMASVMFVCQMTSLWLIAIPGSWLVPFAGMAAAGFFMSLVNSPLQALIMLRIPRHLRPQSLAAFGVFNCLAAPVGLVIAGWALSRWDARGVLAVVLAIQTTAVLTIVGAAITERSALRTAEVGAG
jgi:predicted MFS family arabinose efflux permease